MWGILASGGSSNPEPLGSRPGCHHNVLCAVWGRAVPHRDGSMSMPHLLKLTPGARALGLRTGTTDTLAKHLPLRKWPEAWHSICIMGQRIQPGIIRSAIMKTNALYDSHCFGITAHIWLRILNDAVFNSKINRRLHLHKGGFYGI